MQNCWLFLRWICWFFSAEVCLVWINNKKEASPLLALQKISISVVQLFAYLYKGEQLQKKMLRCTHNCIVWDPSLSSLFWGWGDITAWECPYMAISTLWGSSEIFPRVHFSGTGTLPQKFLGFEDDYFLVKNKTKISEPLKITTYIWQPVWDLSRGNCCMFHSAAWGSCKFALSMKEP